MSARENRMGVRRVYHDRERRANPLQTDTRWQPLEM
jgi:hypothetical protein